MIFGNEGMPRSGKSLDSMQHIIDSLNAGRTVVTNVIGVNHKALSEYLSIPLPTVERLLVVIKPPKDMDEDDKIDFVKREFYARRIPDCLWIWDEINQFWPPDRQPLPAEWAKFVTEHGHEGIDVLIMGQDLSELHTTWRKRLQRYTRFTKLDMLGKDDHYHWGSYTNVGKNKYRRTADGKKPYKKEFFHLYESHRETTTNTANYKDGRFGVFQPQHKFYAACFGLLLCFALYNIWGFFNPDLVEEVAKPQDVPEQKNAPKTTTVVVQETKEVEQVLPADPPKPEPIDYLDKFAQQYDLRLTGIIDRKDPQPGQAAFEFELDFVDTSYRVKERMRRVDVSSLGWAIERHPYGLRITKDGVSHVARPWPLDNWGKVPQQTITALGTANP